MGSRWPEVPPPTLDTADLAYIAGFFDGEGCVSVFKTNNTHFVRVTIAQKDVTVLHWIKGLYGAGYLGRHSNGTCSFLQINHQKAIMFLRTILPYLRLKKPQVEYAIQHYEARTLNAEVQAELSRMKKVY